MSESAEATVPLQIKVAKRTRNRFKADAAELDLDMSEFGQLLLDWLHGKVEAENLPADLQRAIDGYKKDRDAKKPDAK